MLQDTEYSSLCLREYEPGDEEAILAAYGRAAPGSGPASRARDLAAWRWRFLENPAGWRLWLALRESGELAGLVAGTGQRVLVDGEPHRCSQVVDALVEEPYAGALGNPGLFVRVARGYAERYGGPPPEGDTLVWGFPVPPFWRVGYARLKLSLIHI